MKLTDKIEITNEDNMLLMARYPDNYFDLAIVDPPYGIGVSKNGFSTIGDGGKSCAPRKNYGIKSWDSEIPKEEYFKELLRVSKNQIIWGGNYFLDYLGATSCFIVWDKDNGDFSMADCELAWSSFNTAVRKVKIRWSGMLQEDMKNKEIRLHPTQKPAALYKWLLDKYAKQGDKILDTHLGSGSIAIACADYGFNLTACELDKEYYDKAIQRIQNHLLQQKLF
jgi:site-specific DNA-methyltransferase (adenine-specific)